MVLKCVLWISGIRVIWEYVRRESFSVLFIFIDSEILRVRFLVGRVSFLGDFDVGSLVSVYVVFCF